jgi:hypothetical protein
LNCQIHFIVLLFISIRFYFSVKFLYHINTYNMTRKTIIPESKICRQKKTQWCYAAVIQMILEHYGTKINQEAIVETIAGSKTNNDPQNPIAYLMETLDYIDERGGCSGSKEIKFSQIKTEIDRGRPIIVKLSGGSGHYVLIVGYDVDALEIILIDPNKSEYTREPFDVSGIKTVNTLYIDAGTGEEHNGPSCIGGFCLTHSPGQRSFGSSAKGSAKGSASASAKGSSPKGSPKGSASASAKGSPKGSSRGGMKSKKSRKSRSTRKKIGGKWSLKYKRSINCKRPRGFSQKQHCKYGRKK